MDRSTVLFAIWSVLLFAGIVYEVVSGRGLSFLWFVYLATWVAWLVDLRVHWSKGLSQRALVVLIMLLFLVGFVAPLVTIWLRSQSGGF